MSVSTRLAEKFIVVIEYEFLAPAGRYREPLDALDLAQLRKLAHASLRHLHSGCWLDMPQVTLVKVGEL